MNSLILPGALSVALLAAAAAAQGPYTVRPIGSFSSGIVPRDINNHGQIVGFINAPSAVTRAVMYDPIQGVVDLGALAGWPSAAAYGINDAGQVVGSSWPSVIARPGRAFLFSPGTGMLDLGEISGPTSEAICIDDHGNIGGSADAFTFTPVAMFRPAGGPLTVANGLGGVVDAIANTGWVVGGGAFWDPSGTVTALPPSPATPLRRARAVNDYGQIAGTMANASGTPKYAFRFDQGSGQLTNLGSTGRWGGVTDIDSRGTVVGARNSSRQTDADALISFAGGAMQRIDNLLVPGSGWDILTITAMNDSGQMVGIARFQFGGKVGVIIEPLTPVSATSVPIGQSCGGQPVLFRATLPILGTPWVAVTAEAPPSRIGATILVPGHHPGTLWPNGCRTYLGSFAGAVFAPLVINAGGNAVARFELPLVPSWVGVPFSAQSILVDPSTSLGWSATGATQLVFGQ